MHSSTESGANNFKSAQKPSSMAKEDCSSRIHSKGVVVRLEPSLAEKLIKKQAVADELEDQLQTLRTDFEDKVRFSENVKQELQRREEQLLQSVKTIEGYLKEMCSLKCEADDMFKRLKSRSEDLEIESSYLTKKFDEVLERNNDRLKVFEAVKQAKICVDKIVADLPNHSTSKGLVQYYLVLNLLRDDLIEEENKYLEEDMNRPEQDQFLESIKTHPFKILAKENTIYSLKSKIGDIRSQNIDLEQQIDTAISTRVKEDLTYYDLQRWINKVYNSIDDTLFPPSPDEPKGTTLSQLKRIIDFVVMGTQIVERLKQTTFRK